MGICFSKMKRVLENDEESQHYQILTSQNWGAKSGTKLSSCLRVNHTHRVQGLVQQLCGSVEFFSPSLRVPDFRKQPRRHLLAILNRIVAHDHEVIEFNEPMLAP